MTSRSLLGAGLFFGWCAVLLNGCGDDITADDDDAMGGGGSTNGGSSARGGMGGTNAGGTNGGSTSLGGTSGGGPVGGTTGGITFEPAGAGGMGGEGGTSQAGEAGDGGMAPIGQAGSGGDPGGGGMAGEGGGAGAAGGGGDWSMAGAPSEGGADDGMAGAAGGGAEPARTCANGCAELVMPVTAASAAREWEIPLASDTDLTNSVITARVRVVQGSVGRLRLFAKNGVAPWGSSYEWPGLVDFAPGTWVTLSLDLTATPQSLIMTAVRSIGLRYEAAAGVDPVRDVGFEVDSIIVSGSTLGPYDFTTSAAPLAMGYSNPIEPGSINWIMPEN